MNNMARNIIIWLIFGAALFGLFNLFQQPSTTPQTNATHSAHNKTLNAALGCKLLLFPAFVLGLSLILPISAFARQALVLQAAAPTAISVLLMAETEQADSTAAAQLIWRSTLMALITVPIWAVLLKTLEERLGT